jgi:hypothetical protein
VPVQEKHSAEFDTYLLARYIVGSDPVRIRRGVSGDGLSVLKAFVKLPFYDVMTAEVGRYGEKGEEYRADTPGKRPYWAPRLHNRDYDAVKLYGGVNIIDENASWTLLECLSIYSYAPPNDTFSFGPFSNGAAGSFNTGALWVIKLGKVLGRHYTHQSNDYTFINTSQSPDLPPIGGYSGASSLPKQQLGGKGKSYAPGKGKSGPSTSGKAKTGGKDKDKTGKDADAPLTLPPAVLKQIIAGLLPGLEAVVRDNINPKRVATQLTPIIKQNLQPKPGKPKTPDYVNAQTKQISAHVQAASNEVVDEVKTLKTSLGELQSTVDNLPWPEARQGAGTVARGSTQSNRNTYVPVHYEPDLDALHAQHNAKHDALRKRHNASRKRRMEASAANDKATAAAALAAEQVARKIREDEAEANAEEAEYAMLQKDHEIERLRLMLKEKRQK